MPEETIKRASCYIHKNAPVDTRLLHQHHRYPQGYGGSKDDPENLLWLCGSCHDLVHRVGTMLSRGRHGEAGDLVYQYQTMQSLSPAGRERTMELAKVVAGAIQNHRYAIPDAGDEQEEPTVIVQLHIPRSLHKELKLRAANYVHPKSGRKLGLYKMILSILSSYTNTDPMHRTNPGRLYSDKEVSRAAAELFSDDDSGKKTSDISLIDGYPPSSGLQTIK